MTNLSGFASAVRPNTSAKPLRRGGETARVFDRPARVPPPGRRRAGGSPPALGKAGSKLIDAGLTNK
jgi:hypothetical protein